MANFAILEKRDKEMSALICGSLAYEIVMVFHDRFREHIHPEQAHILNVSFLVPEMRREFGGAAGNIAYNLKLLGGEPLPMGTVGEDFVPYGEWLENCGIDHRCVRMIEGTFTSQAFITTDMDDNRITAFHPGAMNYSHLNEIPSVPDVDIGVIAADGREGMIEHAEQFAAADIRFIFDPGQGLTTLARDELRRLLDLATWVTVDDYEWLLLRERVGYTEQEVMDRVAALIVTRGGEGACIHVQPDTTIRIPAAKVWEIVDPSGCGDAFRAGLLFGLTNGMDWDTIGRIASLMGAIKIEHYGSQNHRFEWSEFAQRFKKEFGYELG